MRRPILLVALHLALSADVTAQISPPQYDALKGFRIGMTKTEALESFAKLQTGAKMNCSARGQDSESCTSTPIPRSTGITFAKAPVDYVALVIRDGRVEDVTLHIGSSYAPVADSTLAEVGESISAAVSSNPAVHATSSWDVLLRWTHGTREIWLGSNWEKPQGVHLMVMLRETSRMPGLLANRPRTHSRFVEDM